MAVCHIHLLPNIPHSVISPVVAVSVRYCNNEVDCIYLGKGQEFTRANKPNNNNSSTFNIAKEHFSK